VAEELLFNRAARLRVGVPGQEGKDYQGLRINFSIEKSSESNPNTSKIQIYNLSPSSRAFVEQKDLVLILDVGYAPPGNDPLIENINTGDAKKVTNERNGTDWLTTFELGDGETALQESLFNKSFEAGASLTKVIQDVAGSFGKPINAISGITEKTFSSAITLSGNSKEIMDDLVKGGGSEWSIQDDEVIVLGKKQTTNDPVIVVSPATGLLGVPVKREEGIEFTSLLLPRIRPGRRVKLESELFNGVYRVRKVVHTGDTRGS